MKKVTARLTPALTVALLLCCLAMDRSSWAAGPPHCPIVTMKTTKGVILFKLYPDYAPVSCANFIKLVNKHFYDGLKFHRVADLGHTPGPPAVIVQGGDPLGNGSGGPGYTIQGEFLQNAVNNPLTHSEGAVAMAREQLPNSAGSQFYFCADPVHDLDGKYAVFGMVIKGLNVVKKLQVGDVMLKVTVQQ